MKNIFFAISILLFVLNSCRNNTDDIQQIDQVIHMYIDSLGQDMLNSKIKNSYSIVTMNDIDGNTDNSPISVNLQKDQDTLTYLYYIAGAKRILVDSIPSENIRYYRSHLALNMSTRVNDSTTKITRDTLVLNYTDSPEIFQITSVFYNGTSVFNKKQGQPNVVRIHK